MSKKAASHVYMHLPYVLEAVCLLFLTAGFGRLVRLGPSAYTLEHGLILCRLTVALLFFSVLWEIHKHQWVHLGVCCMQVVVGGLILWELSGYPVPVHVKFLRGE